MPDRRRDKAIIAGSPTAARRARAAARRTALLAASLLMSAAAAAAGERAGPMREFVRVVDRPYTRVGLSVTVTDPRGTPIRGLTRDDFTVIEDGAEMEIVDFGPEGERRDRPLSVAVLLDFSESMRSQVKKVRAAALALLEGLRPRDAIMVATFNDQMTVLLPYTSDPRDPERTLKSVGRARGGTALFRSIEEALKDLRTRSGRKVILVVTDGLDSDIDRTGHVLQSLYLQDLLRLCFRTQTIVYGVLPGMAATSWLPFEGFVEQTGGRLLYTGGDLEHLFARLGGEFLSQYYIAYEIDPKLRKGKRRRIRIEVRHPGVVVKAMRGYATPPSHLDTLLGDLADDDAGMRADAAYELGFVGGPRAARALRVALQDREAGVRRLAIDSLARLDETEAIPDITRMLADGDPVVRNAAAEALLGFGPRAAPHLAERLLRGRGRRRASDTLLAAARMLGKVGDDRALAPLEALLAEGSAEARAAAASALGDLGLSRGLPALRAALADRHPEVRLAALRSIVAVAGRAARALVEEYLREEDDPAFRARARALLEGS